jgi:hypothetical protein
VPAASRYLMDKLPGGHAPRVGDRFGANERGMLTYHGTSKAPTENNPPVTHSINDAVQKRGGGLWSKKFAAEVESRAWTGRAGVEYDPSTVVRANLEAIPRALKKDGWTMRHSSTGRSGRQSSRYLVSPSGDFEVRLSDHKLPRSRGGVPRGQYWDEDIVLNGTEDPADVLEQIRALGREYAE